MCPLASLIEFYLSRLLRSSRCAPRHLGAVQHALLASDCALHSVATAGITGVPVGVPDEEALFEGVFMRTVHRVLELERVAAATSQRIGRESIERALGDGVLAYARERKAAAHYVLGFGTLNSSHSFAASIPTSANEPADLKAGSLSHCLLVTRARLQLLQDLPLCGKANRNGACTGVATTADPRLALAAFIGEFSGQCLKAANSTLPEWSLSVAAPCSSFPSCGVKVASRTLGNARHVLGKKSSSLLLVCLSVHCALPCVLPPASNPLNYLPCHLLWSIPEVPFL